jgi:hypothetical protein
VKHQPDYFHHDDDNKPTDATVEHKETRAGMAALVNGHQTQNLDMLLIPKPSITVYCTHGGFSPELDLGVRRALLSRRLLEQWQEARIQSFREREKDLTAGFGFSSGYVTLHKFRT